MAQVANPWHPHLQLRQMFHPERRTMPGPNVLIVFYSRTGVTETQALASGVGAVQARASIRLRRLRDATDEKTISAHPKWVENRNRMNKEYLSPAEADAAWADAIILAAPHGFGASSPEIAGFLSLLRSSHPGAPLSKKVAGAFVSTSLLGDDDPGVASILSSFESMGMIALPLAQSANSRDVGPVASPSQATEYTLELAQAQDYGRLLADKAAALKSNH
jgi:multimeric flavodoxin WrbA